MASVSDVPVCKKGRHPATITNFESAQSKSSGNDMMVVEFTVDAGSEAGHKLVDYITFGGRGRFGEIKLRKLCELNGYVWREKDTLEEFVAQFPINQWRVGIVVDWDYRQKIGPKNWKAIDEAAYHKIDDDELRMISARVTDYFEYDGDEGEDRLTFEDDGREPELVEDDDSAPWA